jgi:hypothetical protein
MFPLLLPLPGSISAPPFAAQLAESAMNGCQFLLSFIYCPQFYAYIIVDSTVFPI